MQTLQPLYDSLSRRLRPEDVAHRVLEVLGDALTRSERVVLTRAAAGSLANQVLGYTSMLQDFARPVGAAQMIARGQQIFDVSLALDAAACDDAEAVEVAVRRLGVEIRKRFGANDFRTDRLSRAARKAEGVDCSRRKYNRRFRHLVRMERKLLSMTTQARVYRLTRVGKAGLATELAFEQFAATPDTASFIAYYVAKRQLRSEFTVYGQQRAFDEVAELLFARCVRDPATSWLAIAHVMPHADVLARLSEEQKGSLLGRWDALLMDSASFLGALAARSRIDFKTMIVARGNDSTRWNQTAGAFNEARTHYIALLHALGAEAVLDVRCPGKVCKLIAADVAAWHRSLGRTSNSEVDVQYALPHPWDVLSGDATCTRADVEHACFSRGVVPDAKGWTAPRKRGPAVPFRPTPELVHGVSVASPVLANALRSAGFYSGKRAEAIPFGDEIHSAVIATHVANKEKGL